MLNRIPMLPVWGTLDTATLHYLVLVLFIHVHWLTVTLCTNLATWSKRKQTLHRIASHVFNPDKLHYTTKNNLTFDKQCSKDDYDVGKALAHEPYCVNVHCTSWAMHHVLIYWSQHQEPRTNWLLTCGIKMSPRDAWTESFSIPGQKPQRGGGGASTQPHPLYIWNW